MTDLELEIKLDQFKPREYQLPVCDAFLNKGCRKLMIIWPRRCLHGDTHITMVDGSFKLLKDIKVGDSILSWNGSSFEPDTVKNAWKTEQKNTLIVNAKAWPSITTSEDHLFAACNQDSKVNWIKASELSPFHQLQLYGGIECGTIHDPDLAEFIGYMVTDGYVSGYQQPKFTNVNINTLKRVEYLALKLFGITVIWRKKGNGYDIGLSNGSKGGGYIPNKVKMLFRDYGIDIPKNIRPLHPLVWQFDRESIGRFLAAVIACDGSLYTHKESVIYDKTRDRTSLIQPYTEISISCGKCHEYGWGMYWLLRKIGIQSQVPKLEHGGSNFKLSIGRHDQIKSLLSYGPIYGKEEKQKIALDIIENRELTPHSLYNGCYRSRIDQVKQGDIAELYDIETEKNHNFIANGYIVHNSGKDLVCFNLLLRAAIQKVGIYYAIYPTYSQAKKIVWDGMTNSGFQFLSFIPKELIKSINASEMKIVLRNNSLIQLVGSTDYDKLMGTNVCGCMISEYGLTDGQAYGYIRPMLNANDGFCMILSTPRGHNCLWELYSVAINSPDWFVSKLTLDDTKHIDPMLIEHEIASGEVSRDLALQEYWTSFSCGQAGSFYGSIIDRMRLNGQIASVPYESHLMTSTSWDIGLDTCAVIFFQVTATGLIRIIDFYENQNLSLDHYIGVLKSKHYLYNKHVAPHDMANREFSSGVSRLELAKRLDVKFTLAPNISIQDGIEATRAMLSKTYIDDVKCASLIKHLENYRQEYDEKRKTYTGKPLHDIHSHACFVGDTKISMADKELAIKDVQEGMFVKTPFGLRKVLKVHKSLTNTLVDVYIGKSHLICTPEHDIFTHRGLVKSDTLQYNDVIEPIGKLRGWIWQKIYGLCSRDNGGKGFKNIFLSLKMDSKYALMATFLHGMDSTIKANQESGQRCKEQFGCGIMEQSQRSTIFITLMAIARTIPSRILSLLKHRNMPKTIYLTPIHGHNLKSVKTCCILYEEKQQNGIEAKKEELGIECMHKTHCQLSKVLNTHLNVSIAEKTSSVLWCGLNTVQIVASKSIELFCLKIQKIAIAAYAELYFLVINIVLKRHVVRNVTIQQLVEPREVYDLTIEDDHCYYANGYLVSNSDALRMLAVALPKVCIGTTADDLDRRYREAMYGEQNKLPKFFRD